MDNTIGLVAVILSLGFPTNGIYPYYSVRTLRSQERLAAMARGVEIPMAPELSQGARGGVRACCWLREHWVIWPPWA